MTARVSQTAPRTASGVGPRARSLVQWLVRCGRPKAALEGAQPVAERPRRGAAAARALLEPADAGFEGFDPRGRRRLLRRDRPLACGERRFPLRERVAARGELGVGPREGPLGL